MPEYTDWAYIDHPNTVGIARVERSSLPLWIARGWTEVAAPGTGTYIDALDASMAGRIADAGMLSNAAVLGVVAPQVNAAAGSAAAAAGSANTAQTAAAAATGGTFAGPELARNLLTNPSFEVDTNTWFGANGGVIERVTNAPKSGTYCLRITPNGSAYSGATLASLGGVMTLGKTYTWSMSIYSDSGRRVNIAPDGLQVVASSRPIDAAGGMDLHAGMNDIWITGIEGGSSSWHVRSVDSNAAPFYLDALMLIEGATRVPYFDGSSPGCAWLGNAHQSASVKRLPNATDLLTPEESVGLARNLFVDPMVGAALVSGSFRQGWHDNWMGPGGVGTTTAVAGRAPGERAWRKAWTTGTSGVAETGLDMGVRVRPNTFYSFGMDIRAAFNTRINTWVNWYDKDWNAVGSEVMATAGELSSSGDWRTFSHIGALAPATAYWGTFYVMPYVGAPSVSAGAWIEYTRGQVVEGFKLPALAFSGDSPGCMWEGARFASASLCIAPAVPELIVPVSSIFPLRNELQNPRGHAGGTTTSEPSLSVGEDGVISHNPNGLGGWYSNAVRAVVGEYWAGRVEVVTPSPVPLRAQVHDDVQYTSSGIDVPAGFVGFLDVPPVFALAGPNPRLYVYTLASSGTPLKLRNPVLQKVSGKGVRVALGASMPDGDAPGVMWQGPRRLSPSIQVRPSPEAQVTAEHHAGRYFRGSGSPEGVVSAPVGVEYVDEAATNGAVKWIKASGSGNTGWRVVFGDTGWRDISSVLIDFDKHAAAGLAHIRRVNDRVSFKMRLQTKSGSSAGTTTGSKALYADGGGALTNFRPDGYYPVGLVQVGDHLGWVTFLYDLSSPHVWAPGSGSQLWSASGVFGEVAWTTSWPWPTTLPGTPT